MLLTTDALVLSRRTVKDGEWLLTLLSPTIGKIAALVRPGRDKTGRLTSLCEPFTYCNMELYTRGGLYWLRGGSVSVSFFGITRDLSRMALAAYFCDVAGDVAAEPSPALVRLLLNCMHVLAQTEKNSEQVKTGFEWRLAADLGFCPDFSGCADCGAPFAEPMYLDVMNGRLLCPNCLLEEGKGKPIAPVSEEGVRSVLLPMSPAVTAAARYILGANDKSFLSFSLPDGELRSLCRVGETYLLSHLERSYSTLEFYRSLQNPSADAAIAVQNLLKPKK